MKRALPAEFEHDSPPRPARRRHVLRAGQKSPKMTTDHQAQEEQGSPKSPSTAMPTKSSDSGSPLLEASEAAEALALQDSQIIIPSSVPPNTESLHRSCLDISIAPSATGDSPGPSAEPIVSDLTGQNPLPFPSDKASALIYGPPNLPDTDKPTFHLSPGSPRLQPIDLCHGHGHKLDDLPDAGTQLSSLTPVEQHLCAHSDASHIELGFDVTGTHAGLETSIPDPAIHSPAQDQSWLTQIAPAMVPDPDISDEAYAESTNTSYVTSIASEISRGMLENERVYPNYGQHTYGMPVDEDEMDRMDLQHRKYELVLDNRHFLAPIGPNPQKILDLGTGTGIWALDMADMYPSASVIGVDIALIQPKWVATNCQFEIDDVEATWTYKKSSFDFIHFRDPLYCVRDWPRLMQQCFDHIKPGGWCELACIYPVVKCDDGTMPEDSGFKVICDKFMEASAIIGTPTDSPIRFAKYLREAGFVDVSENIFKIPSAPWPKDRRLKQIGLLEMTNVVEGAAAFGLRAFSQAFGWSKERTELAMVGFKRDVKNRAYHQYCEYYVVYGQKPSNQTELEI